MPGITLCWMLLYAFMFILLCGLYTFVGDLCDHSLSHWNTCLLPQIYHLCPFLWFHTPVPFRSFTPTHISIDTFFLPLVLPTFICLPFHLSFPSCSLCCPRLFPPLLLFVLPPLWFLLVASCLCLLLPLYLLCPFYHFYYTYIWFFAPFAIHCVYLQDPSCWLYYVCVPYLMLFASTHCYLLYSHGWTFLLFYTSSLRTAFLWEKGLPEAPLPPCPLGGL